MRVRSARSILSALVVTGLMALGAGALAAHDLFLKLDSYYLPMHAAVRVTSLNGTFTKSEGAVARDRVEDLALVGPRGRRRLDTAALAAHHDTSDLHLRTEAEGTYVLGLSVRAREIALTSAQFNEYLKEEGIEDVLAERTRSGMLGEPAKERYAKHVKAIFQVGKTRSDAYATVLGYPAEIVPLENPYKLKPGATLRVRCLIGGQPMGGLVVLAGGGGPEGDHLAALASRTNADGVAKIRLRSAGKWYVKFIRMRPSTLTGINYESQWATLTFQVR